jgi:hypothetical protein
LTFTIGTAEASIDRLLAIVEAAYTAGIFDGEGTVIISGPTPSEPRKHRLRLAVAMTHLPTIEYLHSTWGPDLHIFTHAPTSPRHAPWYEFRLYGKRAIAFLKVIEPYVITKAPVIAIALKYPEARTPEEREAVRQQLRYANRRGPR